MLEDQAGRLRAAVRGGARRTPIAGCARAVRQRPGGMHCPQPQSHASLPGSDIGSGRPDVAEHGPDPGIGNDRVECGGRWPGFAGPPRSGGRRARATHRRPRDTLIGHAAARPSPPRWMRHLLVAATDRQKPRHGMPAVRRGRATSGMRARMPGASALTGAGATVVAAGTGHCDARRPVPRCGDARCPCALRPGGALDGQVWSNNPLSVKASLAAASRLASLS